MNNTDKSPDASQQLREILHIQDALHQQAQVENKSISSNSSVQNSTNESQTLYSSSQSNYSNGPAQESRLAQMEVGLASLVQKVQSLSIIVQESRQESSIIVQELRSFMQGSGASRNQLQQDEIEDIIQHENAAYNTQVQNMPYSQNAYGPMNPVGYSQNTTAQFDYNHQQQHYTNLDLQYNNYMPMQPAGYQQDINIFYLPSCIPSPCNITT